MVGSIITMNERTIAARALEQLRFQTGLVGHVSRTKHSKADVNEALVKFDNLKTQLVAHLREGAISGRAMADLIRAAKDHDNLVIADYINDEDGARFRESNINYLDNVGNAYLNIAPVYVLIQGKKPRDSYSLDKEARLFTETGLRVVFALLIGDQLLNASYRKIADYAGVSMGTIGWVLRELKNQEYIVNRKGRYAWSQRVNLVKKWVEEYPQLRQKFSLGVFYTHDKNWSNMLQLDKYDAVIGGDISAIDKVKGFKPTAAEVFVGKHRHRELIKDLDLIPASEIERLGSKVDEGGLVRIEILNKFWGVEDNKELFSQTVHPLLTYASLTDSWEPKSRELASKVARRFL
jgi:hypothetical protein